MLKKALLWDEDRNQFKPSTGFLQFYVKTMKVCRCFASFSSEHEHFTHGMYITALIRPSDVKNRTDHVLWRNDANVFRRGGSFAIALIVTSRSSSLEDTMSVHAGAERNVCIIKVSAETPKSTTNPSQASPYVQTSALTPGSPPKTPTTFSSAFCADVLQMQVSGIVHWPKLFNLSTRMYASVHEIFHLSQVTRIQ